MSVYIAWPHRGVRIGLDKLFRFLQSVILQFLIFVSESYTKTIIRFSAGSVQKIGENLPRRKVPF